MTTHKVTPTQLRVLGWLASTDTAELCSGPLGVGWWVQPCGCGRGGARHAVRGPTAATLVRHGLVIPCADTGITRRSYRISFAGRAALAAAGS